MNKKEYGKALRTKEWKHKRKEILKRDIFACTKCASKDNLHVHHTYYLEGKMPWEVPNDCLITLCKTCHEKEHEGRDIQSFIKKLPPKQKPKKKKRKLSKREKLRQSVPKKDEALQKKYDELNRKREEFFKKKKK